MDPEGAQFGVLLELPDLVHRPKRRLRRRLVGQRRFIRQATDSLLDPALERGVDGGAARLQVPSDARDVPAFGMQPHDRSATVEGVSHLRVAREAPLDLLGRWLGGQDLLNGGAAGPSLEASLADRRQLVGPKRRVLGLELDDRLTVGRWERALILDGLGLEEALHPRLVEAADLPIDRAGGDPGLLRTLDRWCAEHDDGPNQLIARLLQPIKLELELLPIIGGLERCSLAAGHLRVLPIPGVTALVAGLSG